MKTLDLHDFDLLVKEFKDDLQGEVNRWVLKHDVHQAAGLAAIDAVERLAHRVTARLYNLGEQPEVIPSKNVKPFKRRKPGQKVPGLPDAVPAVRKRVNVEHEELPEPYSFPAAGGE